MARVSVDFVQKGACSELKTNVTLLQETLLLEPMYEVPYVLFY